MLDQSTIISVALESLNYLYSMSLARLSCLGRSGLNSNAGLIFSFLTEG